MSWSVLEKLLSEVATHSTLIGKYWFSFLFVFRVIVVLSVGDKVYGDEQSKFVCNTLQPGCDNICFNQFSPISHIRFWAMQILLVSLPSIVFIVWAMHTLNITKDRRDNLQKLAQQQKIATDLTNENPDLKPKLRHRCPDAPPKYSTPSSFGNDKESVSKKARNRRSEAIYNNQPPAQNNRLPVAEVVAVQTVVPGSKTVEDPPILAAYVLHICFRMAIEAVFIVLQYFLFRFYVPEMYRCQGYPCPQLVECFISRPMEKNVFLIFMYVISGVCLMMDFMEVNYFGFRKCIQILRGKKGGDYLREFEQRWHADPVLSGGFNPTRAGLRRHRDMSITDASGTMESSDDGSGFE